ncbi:diguanylate cyclase [Frateuria aurantia]
MLAEVHRSQASPTAILELALPYWRHQPTAGDDFVALGIELLAQASLEAEDQDRVAIGERLMKQPLPPAIREQVMHGYLQYIRNPQRLHALEREVGRLTAQRPSDRAALADLWLQLAAGYTNSNDVQDGMRLATLAKSVAPRPPSLIDYQADEMLAVGDVRQGKFPEALTAMHRAETTSSQLGRPEDPSLLLNVSALYIYVGEWQKAIVYAQRALDADSNPHLKEHIEREAPLSNMGAAYAKLGNVKEAQAAYRQAIAIAKHHHRPYASPLNNLGDLLESHGQAALALPMFRDALRSYQQTGDGLSQAVVWSNIGAALADLGRRKAAASAFEQSLAMFGRNDDVDRRLELYPRMISNLEAMGRYRRALHLLHAFEDTSDQRNSVTSTTRIAQLQAVADMERQKRQLTESQQARTAQQPTIADYEKRAQRERMSMGAMIVTLAGLSLIGLLLYLQSRTRKRLNLKLATSNAELVAQREHLADLNAEIIRQNEEDTLTGLYNRRYGQAVLGGARTSIQRGGAQDPSMRPSVLMMIDIDHFKQINDRYGHEVGDRALIHFADILRRCSRPEDILVRWGGEEFLWIFPGMSLANVASIFERLRVRLREEPLVLASITQTLTVSAGYGLAPAWPCLGDDWTTSLGIVDAALYHAKSRGRDCLVGLIPKGDPDMAGAMLARTPVAIMLERGWLSEPHRTHPQLNKRNCHYRTQRAPILTSAAQSLVSDGTRLNRDAGGLRRSPG